MHYISMISRTVATVRLAGTLRYGEALGAVVQAVQAPPLTFGERQETQTGVGIYLGEGSQS